MDVLANLAPGFQTAMSLSNLLYCLVGVFLGTAVGVLPGIGPVATIAMLLPITFGLPPARHSSCCQASITAPSTADRPPPS